MYEQVPNILKLAQQSNTSVIAFIWQYDTKMFITDITER